MSIIDHGLILPLAAFNAITADFSLQRKTCYYITSIAYFGYTAWLLHIYSVTGRVFKSAKRSKKKIRTCRNSDKAILFIPLWMLWVSRTCFPFSYHVFSLGIKLLFIFFFQSKFQVLFFMFAGFDPENSGWLLFSRIVPNHQRSIRHKAQDAENSMIFQKKLLFSH